MKTVEELQMRKEDLRTLFLERIEPGDDVSALEATIDMLWEDLKEIVVERVFRIVLQ
jgi:hypothetical protein